MKLRKNETECGDMYLQSLYQEAETKEFQVQGQTQLQKHLYLKKEREMIMSVALQGGRLYPP